MAIMMLCGIACSPNGEGINNEGENPSLPIEPTGVVGETAIEGHIIDEKQ